jgi:hypothetical protein
VEVKIGIQFSHRELVLECPMSPDAVAAAVSEALSDQAGVLSLVDEKGRRVIVPVTKLAYVEIAETTMRPVGFTAS